MKIITLFVCCILFATRVAAAAPESLAGFVFYGPAGSNLAHVSADYAVELRSGDVLHGLYFRAQSGGASYLMCPGDGTWSYERTGETTARLVLKTSGGSTRLDEQLELRFTSDRAGWVQPNPEHLYDGGSFRIAPIETAGGLVNCSNRSYVRAGSTVYSGFVVAGSEWRSVLVRAVGPGLRTFGITDVLPRPALSVGRLGAEWMLGANAGWSGSDADRAQAITRVGALVGAFPLSVGSADSALLLELAPGAYVAQVSSADGDGAGEVMIETYLLP
jgi:hypothetical protein